jgi:quinol monooxygenase YgiN
MSTALHPQVLTVPALQLPATGLDLVVDVEVPVENQAAFEAIAAEAAAETRREPGCLYYAFTRVRGAEPNTRFQVLSLGIVLYDVGFFPFRNPLICSKVIEAWASSEALQAHAASAHMARLGPQLRTLGALKLTKVAAFFPNA